jgi:putative RNA 2'-phosphotransferase
MATRRQDQKEIALVRVLSYALGVHPDEFGLLPDPEGWVSVKELVKALHEDETWRHVRESMIAEAAERLAPEALELSGTKVRAKGRRPPLPEYGPQPPAHLYYAARRRGYAVIRERGLSAPEGGSLLLAADPETALRLGQRRDAEPVPVTVQAHRAMGQGVVFAQWGERLWLCDHVPPDCLMGPTVSDELLPRTRPTKPAPPPPPSFAALPPSADSMPGSFLITAEDVAKPYKRKGIKKDIAWKKERHKDKRKGE